jgi:hypothetical protein
MFPLCSIGVKPRDETIPADLVQPLSVIRTMPSPATNGTHYGIAGQQRASLNGSPVFWARLSRSPDRRPRSSKRPRIAGKRRRGRLRQANLEDQATPRPRYDAERVSVSKESSSRADRRLRPAFGAVGSSGYNAGGQGDQLSEDRAQPCRSRNESRLVRLSTLAGCGR